MSNTSWPENWEVVNRVGEVVSGDNGHNDIIPDNPLPEEKPLVQTRNAKGQFVKGTAPGPGRPTKAEELKQLEKDFYHVLKTAAAKDGEMEAIAQKLIARAKNGSYQHIKLLFNYLLGSPEQYINVTGDQPPMILFDASENE